MYAFVALGCDGNFSLFSGDAHSVAAIKNWGNFHSLGINGTGSRGFDSETGYKLVGIKSDGSIEALIYDDDKGKEVTKSLYVGIYVDYGRFALVLLSPQPFNYLLTNKELSNLVAFGGDYFNDGDPYLLDKETGKFYYLDDRIGVIQLYDQGNSLAWEIGNTFYALSYTAWEGTSGMKAFRIQDNGQLAVETIHLESYDDVRTDRYGNTFFKSNGVRYILTTENQLNTVPNSGGESFYFGFNNIAYYIDYDDEVAYCYNESGDLFEPLFVPKSFMNMSLLPKKIPIFKDDYDAIYWEWGTVYWVHFTDNEKMQYELNSFNISTDGNITICGDHLIWLEDAEIQTLHWQTGVFDTIILINGSNTVFVNEIIAGGDGKVYFSGVDQQRNTINGVLNDDLTYNFESTAYSHNSSSIVYISPVN